MGVLALGGAVRIWLTHEWRPAFVGYPDAVEYVSAAHGSGLGFFESPYRPAGYPMFLSSLHAVDSALVLAIVKRMSISKRAAASARQ